MKKRDVVFYKHYFNEFYLAQTEKVRKKMKNKDIMDCRTLDELVNIEFGEPGTKVRDDFDKETDAFCLAQTLREERLRAGLTQEQLAEKIGTKKTYISKLENGKADIQLNTLFRIFEGLGRRVQLTIL
jgi:DNA-binding XRE family transcriptional regulator